MVSGAPASAVAPRAAADLVTRLRAGEPPVLEALVSDHASLVWRLAHALSGDARVAEAVAQAVIGGLLEGGEACDQTVSPSVGVYRLAVSATLARESPDGGPADGDRLEDWLPAFDATGHRMGDPVELRADWSEALAGNAPETGAQVRDAAGLLPLDHRLVLLLRDGEGLSEHETAEVLGAPLASVRARLHRARMAIGERHSAVASARC